MDQHLPSHDVNRSQSSVLGDIKTLRMSGKPLFDASDVFIGYHGTGRDITDLQSTQENAAAAERRLLDALEHSHDDIAAYDPSDQLVICNDAYRRHYVHHTTSDVRGKTCAQNIRNQHQRWQHHD